MQTVYKQIVYKDKRFMYMHKVNHTVKILGQTCMVWA